MFPYYGVGVALLVDVGVTVGVGVGFTVGVAFTVGLGVAVGFVVGVAPLLARGGVGVGVTKIIFIALVSSGTGDTIFFPETRTPTMTATIIRNPIITVIAASVFRLSSMALV